MFLLDAVDSVNIEDGRAGRADLDEQVVQDGARKAMCGRETDPTASLKLVSFQEEDRPVIDRALDAPSEQD